MYRNEFRRSLSQQLLFGAFFTWFCFSVFRLWNESTSSTSGSLKPNKRPGYDNISSNVVNETSGIFVNPFKYLFNLYYNRK